MFLVGTDSDRMVRITKPWLAWGLAAVVMSLVALIDVLTPAEFGFSVFYLLPVVWLAWSRGTREALLMALLAGALWYVVDLLNGRPLTSEFYRIWDELNHLLSYLLAAWVVGALRREILAQETLNHKLTAAMAQVRELKGLLPVCAWCHNIRDEEGRWHTMEVFLAKRTGAAATHGICPVCAQKEFETDGPG
jgi:hypothetical protein